MKISALIAVGLLNTAAGSPATAPQDLAVSQWMSGSDIKRELVDTEFAFSGRFTGRVVYETGGEMRMVSAEGRPIYGSWRIDAESGSICSQFRQRRASRESCFRVSYDGLGYRTDQGYRLMPLGF